MITSVYAKLIAAAIVLAVLAAAGFYLHHSGYESGKATVQAKWDAEKLRQANVAIEATAAARAHENAQAVSFSGIESNFLQATTHAYPSLAGALPAAVAAGTVKLRDACPVTPTSCGVSEATARSRALDAAATQAVADRTQNAIAVVRLSDASDARERVLDAQIVSLQAILVAERQHAQPAASTP